MKLTKRKAFKMSIRKWQAIEAGKGVDTIKSCGLCRLCHFKIGGICKGCPIARFTGKSVCQGSPYADYTEILRSNGRVACRETLKNPEERKAARAERVFLQQLYRQTFNRPRRQKVWQQTWWREANGN